MNSALEWFVFAPNALGNSVAPNQFRDVTNEKALRYISPDDLSGTESKQPLLGHCRYYPSLQAYWQFKTSLLVLIKDQHDVSKHRSTIFTGGKYRDDAPKGYFQTLGIAGNKIAELLSSPWAEILLRPEPKKPRNKDRPIWHDQTVKLEPLVHRFVRFVNISAMRALEDSRRNFPLTHQDFVRAVP